MENLLLNNKSIYIEGDKDGFKSISSINKFKNSIKNNWNQDIIYLSKQYIKSEYFWNQVIDKNLCNDSWNLQNKDGNTVWHMIFIVTYIISKTS